MNNLNVIQVSESNSVSAALGISDERKHQLIRAIMIAEFDTNTVTGAAEAMSKICTHPNELFFMAFAFGQKVEAMNSFGKEVEQRG